MVGRKFWSFMYLYYHIINQTKKENDYFIKYVLHVELTYKFSSSKQKKKHDWVKFKNNEKINVELSSTLNLTLTINYFIL